MASVVTATFGCERSASAGAQRPIRSGLRAAAGLHADLSAWLDCGILACTGRGLCPSCTTRRMAATDAHRVEHVLPGVPARHWAVTFPKRRR